MLPNGAGRTGTKPFGKRGCATLPSEKVIKVFNSKVLCLVALGFLLLGAYNLMWKKRVVRLPGATGLFAKHFPEHSYDVQAYRSVKGAFLCWAVALGFFAAAWLK